MHSVLNVLHSFVDKSNIDQQLEVFNATPGMSLLCFYPPLSDFKLCSCQFIVNDKVLSLLAFVSCVLMHYGSKMCLY